MEGLQHRPALLPIMEQLAELQTCACCCLRVAGIRSPQAYSAAAAATAQQLLQQIAGAEGSSAGDDSGAEPQQERPASTAADAVAVNRAEAGESPAAAGGTEAGSAQQAAPLAGQKRRREAEQHGEGEPAAAAEARPPPSPPPCPLCFGLLPVLSASAPHPPSSPAGGAPAVPGPRPAVSLQVLLPPPAWRPPSLAQFLGLPEGGREEVAAAAPGGGKRIQGSGAADGQAGGVDGPGMGEQEAEAAQRPAAKQHAAPQQPEQPQGLASQGAAVPCSGLSDAAGLLAAQFEFGLAAGAGPAAASAGGAGADTAGFALELSIPASLAVRAQALWWRLVRVVGPEALGAAGIAGQRDIVDLKEALKLVGASALSQALAQPANPNAALRISLTASHPPSAAEAAWLAPSTGAQQQRRQRGWWGRGRGGSGGRGGGGGSGGVADTVGGGQGTELPASENLARKLEELSQEAFMESCPHSAAALAPPASAAGAAGPPPPVVSVGCQRRPIYIGGRYLKLQRYIPQSPWFIGEARKGETSVEEEIGNVVLRALRPDAASFISAGREDFDVRMLGAGRPFALEARNARAAPPGPEACAELERAINEAGSGVEVRGLRVLSPAQVAQLKEGEAEKEKSYAALCWLPRPLSDADVAALDATKDLVIQQKTPIRVLHRRANLTRSRTVYTLRAERLPGQQQYFVLHLRTQAGTYIKEFVHGDLGRTQPCLGDLLGGCQAQIVYLDVTDIHMNFL